MIVWQRDSLLLGLPLVFDLHFLFRMPLYAVAAEKSAMSATPEFAAQIDETYKACYVASACIELLYRWSDAYQNPSDDTTAVYRQGLEFGPVTA